jgi:hypothetical protein
MADLVESNKRSMGTVILDPPIKEPSVTIKEVVEERATM